MARDCACALLVRGSRVLMALRSPHLRRFPSCWDLIGGRLEPGETREDALVREVQEETGVMPTAFRPLGALEGLDPATRTPETWWLYVVGAWSGGEPRLANAEHSRLEWFDWAAAQSLQPLASEAYRGVFAELARTSGLG